jgi:RNA polymerase sigma factor (sigma-70 family)
MLIFFHATTVAPPARKRTDYLHGRDAGFWLSCLAMDDLIKLVKTYRLTAGGADRLRLAEEIFRLIEPDLRLFVFKAIRPPAAEDVLQEVLKAAVTGMKNFAGDSKGQFWAWCYRITRNKLNDHFHRLATDREQTMPQDELWQLVESSAQVSPLSPRERHDLEYAMKLLTASKPECYDYLWKHFVFGLVYSEIAEEQNLSYDNVRMKIGRCLDEAKSLVS